MNVLFIGGNVLDADEISSATEQTGFVQLVFKNGDQISLPWRDDNERRDILRSLPSAPTK